jgi:hypothetical protein
LVNILLDNPMTQFSFEWILSLNWSLSERYIPSTGCRKRREWQFGSGSERIGFEEDCSLQ